MTKNNELMMKAIELSKKNQALKDIDGNPINENGQVEEQAEVVEEKETEKPVTVTETKVEEEPTVKEETTEVKGEEKAQEEVKPKGSSLDFIIEEDKYVTTEDDEIIDDGGDEDNAVEDLIQEYDKRFSLEDIEDNSDVDIEVEESDSEDDDDDELLDKLNKSSDLSKYNIKLGGVGQRKSAQRFSNFTPSDNVKVVDEDIYQRALIEQYITGTKGGGHTFPRNIGRVVLPYSGFSIDISSFTIGETTALNEGSASLPFLDRIEAEMKAVYDHMISNSLKRNFETFEEWLDNIAYPDIWSIYFNLFNVNNPGINKHSSRCDNPECGNVWEVEKDNYDITYIVRQSRPDINQEEIEKITNGATRESIKAFKVATALVKKDKPLPESKIRVYYGMPSLGDVFRYLKFAKTTLNESDDVIMHSLYPIQWLYHLNASTDVIKKTFVTKYGMFVRRLECPIYEQDPDNPKKVKVKYVNAKRDLIPILLSSLSIKDYAELVDSKSVKKLMLKDGIMFRIRDYKCPRCGTDQRDMVVDPRDVVFMGAGKMDQKLIHM